MADLDIKFPESHYVGFQARGSSIPLGFMTPDGTDQAATKRKTTVDDWAKGYGYGAEKKQLPAKSFENKPMSGFKLGKNVRHGGSGWGQGNVKWRIEDPRGFELEISSPNLSAILEFCTLENGEILQPCLWGRLRSENILVPVNSDVYEAAQKNTARVNKKASLKDLKPGHKFVMQNGEEGLFLGNHYPLLAPTYSAVQLQPVWGATKRSFYLRKNGKVYEGLDCKASLKLSEIIEEPELTLKECEAQINASIRKSTVYDPGPDSQRVLAVSTGNPKDQSVTLKRIDSTFDDILAFSIKDTYNRYGDPGFHGFGEIHVGTQANPTLTTKYLITYSISYLQNQLEQRRTILAAIAAGRVGYRPDTYDSMAAYTISEVALEENRIEYVANTIVRESYNRYSDHKQVNVKLEIYEKTMKHFLVEATTQTADGTVIQLYV